MHSRACPHECKACNYHIEKKFSGDSKETPIKMICQNCKFLVSPAEGGINCRICDHIEFEYNIGKWYAYYFDQYKILIDQYIGEINGCKRWGSYHFQDISFFD